jgi:ABC-type nitrate/sulfonate/bicarbonate transport system substrate-binding protein
MNRSSHTSRTLTRATLSRRQLVRASAVAAGLALAGCSTGSGSGSGASSDAAVGDASATTEVSFVLDYAPNTNHTGIYVAVDQGYFAEEGLEVEIVQPPEDGADALLGAGGAQMGVSYQDVMANNLASDQAMPYTAVAAIIQHNTSGIMSRAEDAITHPAAMMGHRYATWNMPVEQATIKDIVETDGGDYSQVELVPYDVDDEVSGLKANLFDSVWVFEGWACQNAVVQDFDYNYFSFMSVDPVFDFYTPVIAVNDDFAQNSPEVVKAFLRAAKRGYEYAVDNPDAAADILCAAVPELDSALVHQSQTYLAGQYVADAASWGVIDPERWAAFYQWLNDNDLVENKLETSAGYDLSFLA